VHHAGSVGGCRAMLLAYPDDGVSVAILINLTQTPRDIKGYAERVARGWLEDDWGE